MGAQPFPLQFLTGAGAKAQPVVWLTWGVLGISLIVIVLIGGLLLAAVMRRHKAADSRALAPEADGLSWLWIGVSLTTLALLFTVVWTVQVLAHIQAPPTSPRLTIEVTGRQWWWQVRYFPDDPARRFDTANEIHIPAGEPVRIRLVGGDVIHSFWVPQLAGKMDAIPGLINETWIEARAPGAWLGQCTEYCGVEHARMQLRVIALAPAAFEEWRAGQAADAAPATGESVRGQAIFLGRCGGCHTVRGSAATGTLGPNLSHLMQRQTIGSVLPNDPQTLTHWIADPQSLKPGNRMPAVPLSATERDDLAAYLRTLN